MGIKFVDSLHLGVSLDPAHFLDVCIQYHTGDASLVSVLNLVIYNYLPVAFCPQQAFLKNIIMCQASCKIFY